MNNKQTNSTEANVVGSNPVGAKPAAPKPTGPASGSAFFTAEMLAAATMTEADERYVRIMERCPRCIPHEGEAEPMRLLGDFGPIRGYQCNRCQVVWCITAPPDKGAGLCWSCGGEVKNFRCQKCGYLGKPNTEPSTATP